MDQNTNFPNSLPRDTALLKAACIREIEPIAMHLVQRGVYRGVVASALSDIAIRLSIAHKDGD